MFLLWIYYNLDVAPYFHVLYQSVTRSWLITTPPPIQTPMHAPALTTCSAKKLCMLEKNVQP